MDYLSGWCKSEKTLEGCTAIVTGCNSGIGKETVIDLYARGARVIMACRNLKKAKSAKIEIEKQSKSPTGTGTLIIEKLDLSSLSVKEFAIKVMARENKINILVNNAGVMMCPQTQSYTEDGFEIQMGTNHFGHALLTLLLLPVMAKSVPSRIVNISSIVHQQVDLPLDDINFELPPYCAFAAYSRSKTANILFTKALAQKLKENNIGITTYCLHPGVIRTDLGRHLDKTMWFGATWLFNNILGLFIKTPRCGAQTSIYCAVDEACAEETGLYYSDCAPKLPSEQCQDDDVIEKFWTLTVGYLKYNPFIQDIGLVDSSKD